MNEPLRRLIPQARTLITKESFRDQSYGSLDGYIQDIRRPIDLTPLVTVVHRAMTKYPRQSEAADGWLAPRVHATLRLFRSDAADQGIWDYLSVVVLRDYVLWRMAGKDGLVHDMNGIVGPFRHQAVARLWWAAELSRNGADYRPTVEAFNSEDAVNYLTNVDAFHNRPAALAYIRFISRTSGGKTIKQMAVETGKTLNHVLTTIVLDSLAPDSGGDLDARERWIAEAPDGTLADSVLPKGPDEPEIPEEKIYAVEQLLERLMEEHRWHEVVTWSERWVAAAQAPELAATALPSVPGPRGNGSQASVVKDAVERDGVVGDAGVKNAPAKHTVKEDGVARDALLKDAVVIDPVLYERFVKALRDDLGVESSDQTRDLFEKLSKESALGGAEPFTTPQGADAVRSVSLDGGVLGEDEPQSIDWLDKERKESRPDPHLTQPAREAETLPLDSSELYGSAPLTQTVKWLTSPEPDFNVDELTTPERLFPGTSNDFDEREPAERKEHGLESESARRFASAERRFIEAVAVYFGD